MTVAEPRFGQKSKCVMCGNRCLSFCSSNINNKITVAEFLFFYCRNIKRKGVKAGYQHFLAHLWLCVCRALSRISLHISSSQNIRTIWTKLGRNVPWEVLLKNCSWNLIPSKTLFAMATKWNFFKQFFPPATAGSILKEFHRNVPWMTLFKICLRNLDPSINMALVNGSFVHNMDMKKFLKNVLLLNC